MAPSKLEDHAHAGIDPWKAKVFTPKAEELIAEILQLGGQAELKKTFQLFEQFEPSLQAVRDRLWKDALDHGLEPE